MGLNVNQIITNFQQTNARVTEPVVQHNFNDVVFKPNKVGKYRLRILGLDSKVGRKSFYIGQYSHQIWAEDENGRRTCDRVICPTSSYDQDRNGFKTCPICEAASKVYNEYKSTNDSSKKEFYDTIKRKFTGYIPVYVVSAPAEHSEIKGKCMIMQYTISLQKFLEERIMGVVSSGSLSSAVKNDFDDDDDFKVGADAILTCDEATGKVNAEGYDLQIQVDNKKVPFGNREVTMPDYRLAFYPRMTTIEQLGDGIPADSDGFHQIESSLGPEFDRYFRLHKGDELNRFCKVHLGIETHVETNTANADKIANTVLEEVNAPAHEEVKHHAAPAKSSEKKNDLIDTDDLFNGIEF